MSWWWWCTHSSNAVSSKFSCLRRFDLETEIEIVWVQLKLNEVSNVYIGNVYLPPDFYGATLDLLVQSFDKVAMTKKVNDSIIVFGDYNFP